MAEIEAPELDQQVAQARAAVSQARAAVVPGQGRAGAGGIAAGHREDHQRSIQQPGGARRHCPAGCGYPGSHLQDGASAGGSAGSQRPRVGRQCQADAGQSRPRHGAAGLQERARAFRRHCDGAQCRRRRIDFVEWSGTGSFAHERRRSASGQRKRDVPHGADRHHSNPDQRAAGQCAWIFSWECPRI